MEDWLVNHWDMFWVWVGHELLQYGDWAFTTTPTRFFCFGLPTLLIIYHLPRALIQVFFVGPFRTFSINKVFGTKLPQETTTYASLDFLKGELRDVLKDRK